MGQESSIGISGIDISRLAALIIQLNITRRNYASYPPGHPVVASGLQKTVHCYTLLMEQREEIVFGVVRDALMMGETFLDRRNTVFGDFARVLFERNISVIVLRQGLTPPELGRFCSLLALKRDEILSRGGIETVWREMSFVSLDIRPMRYDLFTFTENSASSPNRPADTTPESLWDRFTRGLMYNSFNPEGDNGVLLDPEVVAQIVNDHFSDIRDTSHADYANAVTDFMLHEERLLQGARGVDLPCEKIASFVTCLNSDLRRQFLTCTFDTSRGNSSMAESILNRIPSDLLLQTLDDMNSHNVTIPPVIMGLMQKLAAHAGEKPERSTTGQETNEDAFQAKIQAVFREHAAEQFIPDDYLAKLTQLISAEDIPRINADIGDLAETLAPEVIGESINEITMNFALLADTPEESKILSKNMIDACELYLRTGEYGQLLKVILRCDSIGLPEVFKRSFKEEVTKPEFLGEILEGLSLWGKGRHREIQQLISAIGQPFIDPLLDHLATEENMSHRRFLMSRLKEFGAAVHGPVSARLNDPRWYFLRNLGILLREVNNPAIVPKLRILIKHPNSKVRYEVLKTLLHFKDPLAVRLVIQGLDSDVRETRISAIQLAEQCPTTDFEIRMVEILAHDKDDEIRCAIINSMAASGNVAFLPELEKILARRSLLFNKSLLRIKREIVNSLRRYPAEQTRPLLVSLAAGGDEFAAIAQAILGTPVRQL